MEKKEQNLELRKAKLLHELAIIFEDAPCYRREEVLQLQQLNNQLRAEKKPEKLEALLAEAEEVKGKLVPAENVPEKIYLWEGQTMPSLGTYTENPDYRYNHDPDFQPYMYVFTVPEGVTPKGAILVCAGADHGDCTLHEGYQTCLDMRDLGYQTFLLLNRTNHCPYDRKEAGVDAARAVRIIRRDAGKYGVKDNQIAFAGFSNGGLTAEACIQFYSGTQRVADHFPDYAEDELDSYYGAPDAVINVYGARWAGEPFDYTNVVYPPTFFAVGREDKAMDNMNAVLPELREHHVEVEVHTFSGVPHGQSGLSIYGINPYPHFQLWLPLADAFLQHVFEKVGITRTPGKLEDPKYRFDAFDNGEVLLNKKKNRLPAMGWNSWNAFGSGNTEALTKDMADAMVELGLADLGYEYLVLDDGCYRPVRVDGKLANEPGKFPNGFKALGDYIHDRGLKFGMYNDVGTHLCAGSAVGTCGHEEADARSYTEWGVDFLKVDNCYYPFDDATFSNRANAKYVYAPNIRSITITGEGQEQTYQAVTQGILRGTCASVKEDYITGIGTLDGTGPDASPVGLRSSELVFKIKAAKAGAYDLSVEYATGTVPGTGSWLQVAVGDGEGSQLAYDNFLPATEDMESFVHSKAISITLQEGENILRLMNHRRQENTLNSYATLQRELMKINPDNDMIFSLCEWGKTQPQNWAYKIGDSWRILNDITFCVGADGDYGRGDWEADYTTSITTQYNKAVIMDEFAGLDRGWNDPDMMVIGMNNVTEVMSRSHMTMWSMMNCPLMLGMDLRRVQKGDALWQIIANKDIIDLNQDALGIPAKRVYSSLAKECPDKEYIRDNHRYDILAKPLADGSLALSFFNLDKDAAAENLSISLEEIMEKLGSKAEGCKALLDAASYKVKNLWSKEEWTQAEQVFQVACLEPCDNVTIKVSAE